MIRPIRNFIAILVLFWIESAAAQDLHFTIATKTGNTTFQMGEVIPVEMSFTSSSPNTYRISTRSYDRSGRLNTERFTLQPESGWDDPLADYFHSIGGFVAGGAGSNATLSEKPTVVHGELNEWVRFRAPGSYRLRVTTQLVSKIDANSSQTEQEMWASNELELTIVPANRDWQEETLRRALAVIDDTTARREAVNAAVKTVRYLGTAEAANEMARRLRGGDFETDYSFGLIGSPERDSAVTAMEQQLTDRNHPVTAQFLLTFSILLTPSGEPPQRMREARADAYARICSQLWSALSNKQDAGKSISVATAISSCGDPIPQLSVDQAPQTFDGMTQEQQFNLLRNQWDCIKSPSMLPVLRRYAMQYQDFPVLRQMTAVAVNELSAAALQRWYELAPDEARPAVITEILRPKPRFDATTLGMLQDDTLPEVNSAVVERFAAATDLGVAANLGSLIERYGSKEILPDMLRLVDEHAGKWPCATQAPALAYFLHADPESARARIEAAVAARGKGYTACNHALFTDISKFRSDRVLERIAAGSLEDDDAQVALNAADFLREFGSAAAEAPLWDRLERWASQWEGQEADLRKYPLFDSDPRAGQLALGESLARALATGRGWIADPPKLERIARLKTLRDQTGVIENQWRNTSWVIECHGVKEKDNCGVLQYSSLSLDKLKAKLSEFPAGSTFVWAGNKGETYQDLLKFAADRALTLK